MDRLWELKLLHDGRNRVTSRTDAASTIGRGQCGRRDYRRNVYVMAFRYRRRQDTIKETVMRSFLVAVSVTALSITMFSVDQADAGWRHRGHRHHRGGCYSTGYSQGYSSGCGSYSSGCGSYSMGSGSYSAGCGGSGCQAYGGGYAHSQPAYSNAGGGCCNVQYGSGGYSTMRPPQMSGQPQLAPPPAPNQSASGSGAAASGQSANQPPALQQQPNRTGDSGTQNSRNNQSDDTPPTPTNESAPNPPGA